jgi:3-dehydroquinate dehydratase
LEQKVELLKIELGEISERAINQAKMYELMLKVFKSNSENSNIDHLVREFEKNKYLIENSSSDEARFKSPEV